MYKKNFGLIAICGLISIFFANVSFAESEVDESNAIFPVRDPLVEALLGDVVDECIALGEEKLQKAIEVREKSQEELRNETIDYETYEKGCNEAINQALSVFDKAIAANPENPNFHYQRGLTMVKWSKNDTDAHAYFDKAIELNPAYGDAYYQKGLLFKGSWRDEEAIEQFDKTILFKPDFGDAYYHRGTLRGWSYSDNLEIRHAIADYKNAINFSSNFTGSAYGQIGYLNWRLGYYDLSIESLTKAIEIEPDFADHYQWRACSMLKLGQVNSAVLDFDRAIRIKVEQGDMGYLRGYIHYMLRKGYGMMEAERYKTVIDVCDELIEHIKKIGDTFFWKPWSLRCDAKVMLGDYKGALLDQEYCLQIELDGGIIGNIKLPPKYDDRIISGHLYKIGLLKSTLGMYRVARQDLMEAKNRLNEFDYNLREDINFLLKHMRCIGTVKCNYHNDGRDCEYDMLEKLREEMQNVDWSFNPPSYALE